MNPERVRALFLSHPGAYEDFPFGPDVAVFRVRGRQDQPGKIFGTLGMGYPDIAHLQANVKAEPAVARELRQRYSAILPAWHMNKDHWNSLVLDGSLDDHLIAQLVEDSWDLVVESLPKNQRLVLRGN